MHYQLLANLHVCPIQTYFEQIKSVPIKGDVLVLTSPSIGNIESVKKAIKVVANYESVTKLMVYLITPEAPIQDLDKIISDNKEPDHIIGIGGGSVIDSAKVLSISWKERTVSELFYGKKDIPNTKISTTVIPTTTGTGAELSHGAILYDKVNKLKGGVRGAVLQPDSVIIDKYILKHAPPRLIAETGFDCLAHAIETYCATASNSVTKYQSISAINIVLSNIIEAKKGNENSLERMAIASSFMGLNLAYSKTCLPHRIQYVIGPQTLTSHAQGLIMLYRGWLPLISNTQVFYELANELGTNVSNLVNIINDLKNKLNINYRLKDYGVQPEDVVKLGMQVNGALDLDPCYESVETINDIINNSI